MSLKFAPTIIFAASLTAIPVSHGAGQEGVVLDPQTGDYIVTYKSGYSGKIYQLVFVPSTKIKPRLKSKFGRKHDKYTIFYRYKVKNGPDSKQNIDMLLTKVSGINPGGQLSPPEWDGIVATDTDSPRLRLAWNFRGDEFLGGLAPGRDLGGFALASVDLPGIAVVQITGAAPVTNWIGHAPQGVAGDQLDEIEKNNFVPRHAAVPRIPVPEPFDATTVLGSIQKHVQELVTMELVEPVFAGQLDALFAAATEALGRDDAESALSHLKDLRHLIQQERHENKKDKKHKREKKKKGKHDDEGWDDQEEKAGRDHQVTRLAARVLRFDVRFVAKRLREELKD